MSVHFSPFPTQIGFSTLGMLSSMVFLLKTGSVVLFSWGVFSVLSCAYFWWAELLEEMEGGGGSLQVCDNIKFSLMLFVFSEAMFLVTFFWTLFHLAFSPSVWSGLAWPPVGVIPISPKGVPLFNTLLLVSSGVTVTWGHHLLLLGSKKTSTLAFCYTIFLGTWFLFNQGVELKEACLTMGDSLYGSIFLVLTGFHGFHVFLGLFMLLEGTDALLDLNYTSFSHTKLEMFIWYWHLVDCIWLVVYSLIYWWAS